MRRVGRSIKGAAIAVMLVSMTAGLAGTLGLARGWRAEEPTGARAATPVAAAASDAERTAKDRVRAALGQLPLYFVQNRGQADARVAYYVQGRDTAVYFTPDGVTFALTGSPAAAEPALASRVPVRLASTGPERSVAAERAVAPRWTVKLDFVGANRVTPTGAEPAPAVVSHFTRGGGAPDGPAETFRGLTYTELWPGIDLVYTGERGQLKSTFVVKPGADPSQIRLAYRGATAVQITDAGRLEVSTPVGGFAEDRPYAYQDARGERREVPVAFALAAAADNGSHGWGFRVGAYDRSQTLVLDPSLIVYAGYLGGAGPDTAYGIAVDNAGNAYVVGETYPGPGFPVEVGPDLGHNGGRDAFVAKINAAGTDLLYLGYIGGTGDDTALAVAVDGAGYAYVTGYTYSSETSFPVKIGPGLTYSGNVDAFVAKVSPGGTSLVYCGYIGGTHNDFGTSIDVDAAGNAYVAGKTASDESTFPVHVGPGLALGGLMDGFVAKVTANGAALVYAGYIGGVGNDTVNGIAVDAAGNAFVAGGTSSDQATFPVTLGPGLAYGGGTEDAFVAKVKADGTGFIYAGYIGGAARDVAMAVAIDSAGSAYVTGNTSSDESTFPVKVGPSLWHEGLTDAFVAKVRADGKGLVYAGYIGGDNADNAYGIAVGAGGEAYVAGTTVSNELTFPVHVGPGLHLNGGDAFVAKVRADGAALLWAGYLGGANAETAYAIAVDAGGNAYVVGYTTSPEASFPVTAGPELVFSGGGTDGFVAKISGKPNLRETFVGVAATAASPGGKLAVLDAVQNQGLGTAPATSVRYWLSTDAIVNAGDILLTGSRAVQSLVPGATHSSTATLTVPSATKLGAYRVIACADYADAADEVDETDNCLATGQTVAITLANLIPTALSNPPSAVKRGDAFSVTDTVANVGSIATAASTNRYYASKSGTKDATAILLAGTRKVPALAPNGQAGSTSTGTVTVTIPTNMPLGSYWLLVCVDDTKATKESDEANNCKMAASGMQVQLPNLRTSSVANPVSSVVAGSSFQVTDTAQNIGSIAAPSSTTKYVLSKDSTPGSDVALAGSRNVPALAVLASNTGSATVTVPAATAAGFYRVLACADALKKVQETVETDNCAASGTYIIVTK